MEKVHEIRFDALSADVIEYYSLSTPKFADGSEENEIF
jgi:hypothetical protein